MAVPEVERCGKPRWPGGNPAGYCCTFCFVLCDCWCRRPAARFFFSRRRGLPSVRGWTSRVVECPPARPLFLRCGLLVMGRAVGPRPTLAATDGAPAPVADPPATRRPRRCGATVPGRVLGRLVCVCVCALAHAPGCPVPEPLRRVRGGAAGTARGRCVDDRAVHYFALVVFHLFVH